LEEPLTRSSAIRLNRNARLLAALINSIQAGLERFTNDQSFNEVLTRQFVRRLYHLDWIDFADMNWELLSELLNRKSWAGARLRKTVREQTQRRVRIDSPVDELAYQTRMHVERSQW
jgi:hypothetical protein